MVCRALILSQIYEQRFEISHLLYGQSVFFYCVVSIASVSIQLSYIIVYLKMHTYGVSYSKSMMLLVYDSLKLLMAILQIHCYFC